jgi:cell division protein FtsZ
MSGEQAELEMDELTEITEYIQDKAGQEAEVIFGHGIDSSLGQSIRVTVIATGFASSSDNIMEPQKKVFDLDSQKEIEVAQASKVETPAFPSFVANPIVAPVVAPQVQAAPAQQASYEPQQPVRRPLEQSQPERTVHILDSNSDNDFFTSVSSSQATASNNDNFATSEANRIADERVLLKQQAAVRRELLRNLSSTEHTSEAIKEKLDVPAYLRRNVSLEKVSHSSERNISRFNLNDDNELLGNNSFLHDNVD